MISAGSKRLAKISSFCPRTKSRSLGVFRRWAHNQHAYVEGDVQGNIPLYGRGIEVGQYAELYRTFSAEDVDNFGDLVGDKNSLHSAGDWHKMLDDMPHLQVVKDAGLVRLQNGATGAPTVQPLVHGMLVSSLFSSIFGTISPGCIYMNQSLQFAAPVFVDEAVKARLEIEKVREWRKGGVVIECGTSVYKNSKDEDPPSFGDVVISGTANVWLPSGHT